MKDSIKFKLLENEQIEQRVIKLRNILSKSGIEVKYEENSLIFNFDTMEVRKKTTRYAGRKRTEGNNQYITVGDIKQLSKTMTHREIYDMLNISKATYFRRKKEAEKKADTEMFLF